MPIVRLTIGPTASNYYQKRVEARLARMHKKKPEEDPEGPRKAARAKMQAKQIHMASESTWRLKKHQALTELAHQQYREAQALEGTRTKSKHSAATAASDASHAITLPAAQQSDFEVLDRNDPNSKYDASAYFQAQSDQFNDLDQRGGRLALTFNPMQADYGHQSRISSEGRALQYMDAERLPGTVQPLALANH